MALFNQRPDTPLAATPEPAPVTSGLQPMGGQMTAQPITRYQRTADAAIQQVGAMSPASMAPTAPAPAGPSLSTEGQNILK